MRRIRPNQCRKSSKTEISSLLKRNNWKFYASKFIKVVLITPTSSSSAQKLLLLWVPQNLLQLQLFRPDIEVTNFTFINHSRSVPTLNLTFPLFHEGSRNFSVFAMWFFSKIIKRKNEIYEGFCDFKSVLLIFWFDWNFFEALGTKKKELRNQKDVFVLLNQFILSFSTFKRKKTVGLLIPKEKVCL